MRLDLVTVTAARRALPEDKVMDVTAPSRSQFHISSLKEFYQAASTKAGIVCKILKTTQSIKLSYRASGPRKTDKCIQM